MSDTIYTGRCKWFNNKTGFGFLTVVDKSASNVGTDVFAHHSGIVVGSEQYRYLVQGEYVSFTIKPSSDNNHSVQASNITGVFGGQLMCETRNDARIASENNRGEGGDVVQGERVRARGEGPRAGGGRGPTGNVGNRRTNNGAGAGGRNARGASGRGAGEGGEGKRDASAGTENTAWAMTGSDGFDAITE